MVPIFKQEVADGLAEAVAKSSITLSAALKPSFDKIDFDKIYLSLAKAGDADLYPLNTILVSTGWNKNFDIFTKEEVWAAKDTPEDKPLNIGHNHTKIVGHITSSSVVNAEGTLIPNDTPLDAVPDFFHILTNAVLYKVLKPEAKELQDEIQKIIAEIQDNKWFVSMECLFRGFDYGMIGAEGSKVIQRNEKTAFLTKYLSSYGGTGVYQGNKIGRVLRNITFSGKGLVEHPANPYSIIIAEEFKPNLMGDKMELKDLEAQVASLTKALEAKDKNDKDEKFDKFKKDADAALATSKTETETSKAKVKELEASVAKLEAEKAEEVKAKAELAAKLAKAETDLAESVKMFNTIRVAKDAMDKEKKDAGRKADASKKMEADKAVAFIAKFEALDDAAFAAVIEALPNLATSTEVAATELAKKVDEPTGAVASAKPEESKLALANDLKAYFKTETKEVK